MHRYIIIENSTTLRNNLPESCNKALGLKGSGEGWINIIGKESYKIS